jgi:hypothetical protein
MALFDPVVSRAMTLAKAVASISYLYRFGDTRIRALGLMRFQQSSTPLHRVLARILLTPHAGTLYLPRQIEPEA